MVASNSQPTNNERYTGSPLHNFRPARNPLPTAREQPRKSRSCRPVCQTRHNPTPSKPRSSRLLRLTPQSTAVFFTTSMGEHAIHHARSTRSASSLPGQRHSSHPIRKTTRLPPRRFTLAATTAHPISAGPRRNARCDARPTQAPSRLPRTGKVDRNCADRAWLPCAADPRTPESVLGQRFGLVQLVAYPLTSGIRREPFGYCCGPHIYRIRVRSLEYEFSCANPLAGGMRAGIPSSHATVRKHPLVSGGNVVMFESLQQGLQGGPEVASR